MYIHCKNIYIYIYCKYVCRLKIGYRSDQKKKKRKFTKKIPNINYKAIKYSLSIYIYLFIIYLKKKKGSNKIS
jgi:hypothetical protein